jgi:hypothetical protein
MALMGTFTASLRAIGDVRALPATLKLEEGRLSIAAGDTEIGTWQLDEIKLEPIPTGYRMTAEGDVILIELKDVNGFNEAMEVGTKRRRRIPSMRKSSDRASVATTEFSEDHPPAQATNTMQSDRVRSAPRPTETPRRREEKPRKTKEKSDAAWSERVTTLVDGYLASAHKRYGALLPDWVFSRGVLVIVLVVLLVMLILPGLASVILLVAGAAIVLTGAIAYSDSVIASRILPGRTTPAHVLVAGLGILLVGVFFGLIANWLG